MKHVERLLIELSEAWSLPSRPTLKVIGCSALLLRTNYMRGTKDCDVFESIQLDDESRTHLLELAGKGTRLSTRWKTYIHVVGNGLPFLPRSPKWHPIVIEGMKQSIAVEALDVVDVVVSKLKRFHANDRADVDAMIRMGHVPHDVLIERFRSACDAFVWYNDDCGDKLSCYVENLHEVERDMLNVDETELELPSWLE